MTTTLEQAADWRTLVEKKPGIHAWPPGQLSFFALPEDVLDYIASLTNESTRSLETGLGASTIVFAARQGHHICITPATDEIERISKFFSDNGVPTDHLVFEPDYSELALPQMKLPKLDVVLIDGRHGFPAPMIDWYYTCKHLKIEGILIVDDTDLWPVQLLVEYLSSSTAWKVDRSFDRTISYQKIADGDESAEWINQSNVETKTTALHRRLRREHQLETAQRLVKSGRIDLLVGKAFRQMFHLS
jgi:hypothetical protein